MKAWRNPHVASFSEAVERFRSGKQSPRDYLEQCIDVIKRRESAVRAFVTLNLEPARRAADASTKRYRKGMPLSFVDGCPVGVKDIMATADMPTQMNSPAFEGWQSGQDAACVQALRHGGAIIIGKTVTTEFAIGYSGPTTNPFDSARTPGGSSSGTAAAVGGGMIPAGLGTQTQGSTLRPASYCGAVGYKPTIGALHMAGIHPLSATCDHLGVIGGTLEDTWRVASQISLGVGSPGYGYIEGAGEMPPAPVKPGRLVRLYTRGWKEIDAQTERAFEAFCAALRDEGVDLVGKEDDARIAAFEDALERDVDGALDIVAYEMQWPYTDYIARFGDRIGKRIHGLIKRANEMTPQDYVALLETRRRMRVHGRTLLKELSADGYVTLASSGPAIMGHEFSGSRSFIVYGSWLGFPAFSLPLLEVGGLPLGVQLMGADRQDGRLCETAGWIMRALR